MAGKKDSPFGGMWWKNSKNLVHARDFLSLLRRVEKLEASSAKSSGGKKHQKNKSGSNA